MNFKRSITNGGRRQFLRASGALAALAAAPGVWAVPGGIGVDGFVRLSRVLTGVDELDAGFAKVFLAALQAEPEDARVLAALWRKGGFAGGDAPRTVSDLATRGVFDDAALAALADRILIQWYSGRYEVAGETRVATYTGALAWRTPGSRPAGPTACAGAMGHWSRPPAV